MTARPAATRTLNKSGMKVTLDYLGESVHSRDEARHAADVYLEMIGTQLVLRLQYFE